MFHWRTIAATLMVAGLPTSHAASQPATPATTVGPRPGIPSTSVPPILREVGFDQRLTERVPLDIELRDEAGRAVALGDYFTGKPVILALVYYDCPMLCTHVLNGLVMSLKVLSLEPGRDFMSVTVSFDPAEAPALAAAKKRTYLDRYARPGAEEGWRFLTADESQIRRITSSVGFRYVYDQQLAQYAHPTGIVVLTPDARISRYLFGVEYAPRDLRLALVEASAGRIGNPIDRLLLYCYHYDPATGRYGLIVMRLVRLGGAVTLLALGTFVFVMWRRERGNGQPPKHAEPTTDHEPGTY